MKYKNKRILITGGTGSFGSTATKYFLKQGAEEVRILSRDEKKQEELRFSLSDSRLKTFIGDVRDANSLTQAISDTIMSFMPLLSSKFLMRVFSTRSS